MKRLFYHAGLVVLWLLLCVLLLSGCHATAPAEALGELDSFSEAAERTLLENLYLFVGTDYGEFCAFVACGMAAHLILLIKQLLIPWLSVKAPRLLAWLKAILRRISFLKNGKNVNISLPNDVVPSFDEEEEDAAATQEQDAVLPRLTTSTCVTAPVDETAQTSESTGGRDGTEA